MAADIIAFPSKLFAASHPAPRRPSQSAEEAAFNRPRFGLNLGNRSADRPWAPLSTPTLPTTQLPPPLPSIGKFSIGLPAQIGFAVAHFDLEIAHYAARLHLLRLMTQQHCPTA